MKTKVLIVEDQFVEANDLQLMLVKAGYGVCGIARTVVIAQKMIEQEKPDLVLLDIFLKGKLTGIDLARELKENNIAFIFLSANSSEDILTAAKATQPYGFLVKPFREKDLLVTLEIAAYRHEHSLESVVRKEAILQEQLAEVIAGSSTWNQKILDIGKVLQPYIPFDFIAAGFNTMGGTPGNGVGFLRIGFDEYQLIGMEELSTIARLTVPEILSLAAVTTTEPTATLYNGAAFEAITQLPSLKKLFADTFQVRSHLSLPVSFLNEKAFSFCLYSKRPDTYHAKHILLYGRLQQLFNNSMEAMLKTAGGTVAEGPVNEQVDIVHNQQNPQGFEGIIGKSHLLLNVFDHITQVAPTDTSVLILGESGTGKERIAACIHNLSPRKAQRLVKVNCAALPPTLIESELFGHEKGAFTGAIDRRIGKFEQADKGTIFLDEIGELPFELQVKLLRVLQEKEIERIGAKMPTKIDIRIIAATNRTLEKEVAEGRFRLDLYYRLNVFPLLLPPLRERKEDIPALAYHFMHYYNRKTGKRISGFSDRVLKSMMAYSWPGNIRELEHLIERSILLAKGDIIENMSIPASFSKEKVGNNEEVKMKTIHENERDHIISVLKKCNGRIWGPGAAAEILNIPPTTLKSKMDKLGIKKVFME